MVESLGRDKRGGGCIAPEVLILDAEKCKVQTRAGREVRGAAAGEHQVRTSSLQGTGSQPATRSGQGTTFKYNKYTLYFVPEFLFLKITNCG